MELHNSYSSSSSSRGINVGATIGYGHKIQTTGNGRSISASRSNRNTDETIHANGNFRNVNEVHNNTGTMTLSGFNQEGGKVTGNIGNLVVESRQNTSTITGSSKGVSVGVSSQGIPTSVNVNASRTNGNRAFVDNQSTFIVGEGSNLHVGTVENTGAVIGKEGNSTFKIDTYAGKDIQNYDTMTTTGGSIGVSLGGNPKITNVGFNQDSRDKQGITRNTVVGDVEIGESSGSPINRDLEKANEVTKDTHSRTNINIESQTIEYATNPGKLKEDIGKAKEEINDIKWAIKESIHDRGDDNRNFFGQLSEVRLNKSLENITGERLIGKTVDTEIAGIFKDAYKDLGYDINIIFSDPKNSPQLLDEKGLESTGRASNEYFSEKYKDDNPAISIQSDGKDYSNVDFGENVGDKATNGAVAMNKANILGLKDPENSKKVYNISDMEKTINSTFSNKVKINEDRYKKDPDYRDKINYYYFQAKYQLKDGKIIEDGVKDRKKYIKINKNGKIITLFEVSKEESLYHNVNYSKDGSFYIETDPNKINRKFVNEDGYEIVLSNNLSTIIKNPTVYGTFNYYTYKGIEYDTLNHTVDINLWQKYGSGPDDWTTEAQRKKANALAQKLSKVPFFSDQGFKNYLNSRKITKVTPDTYENYLEIIKGAI